MLDSLKIRHSIIERYKSIIVILGVLGLSFLLGRSPSRRWLVLLAAGMGGVALLQHLPEFALVVGG